MKWLRTKAEASRSTVVLSMDAKAAVKVGRFSRGGKSLVAVNALDHDFSRSPKVTPYGILDMQTERLSLFLTRSKITADFIVDCLEHWWNRSTHGHSRIRTLVLLLDNGPENSSRRTRFVQRIVQFVDKYKRRVVLAYYPPYHSKYNRIERVWGVLEKHWGAALLDSEEAIAGYAASMTWCGLHPTVYWVTKVYPLGVRLSTKEMKSIEARLCRLPELEKWFVDIPLHGGSMYFEG